MRVSVALTNKVATVPVRGAGHPAANFAMERLLDRIARELKLDRSEVRRRNLIPPDKMPYNKKTRGAFGERRRVRQRRLSKDDGNVSRGD